MAGFAVLFQPDSTAQERESDFQRLLCNTAEFKGLDLPAASVTGRFCTAAKFDAPSTIHPGIVRDEESGSWLIAAGTVVALEGENDPRTQLQSLLREYIEKGSTALDRFDGHFALVISNNYEQSLSIISDPIGLFSIFYGYQGKKVFISNSALAVAKLIHSKPDVLRLEHFLRMGRLDAANTLWIDVRRLLAARILKFSGEQVEEIEYWSPSYNAQISQLPLNDALNKASNMLGQNFSRLLTREGKIWADLTGGFDSRITTTILSKMGIPFITYCLGPENYPDVQFSKQISNAMNWEYRHIYFSNQWEPEYYHWFDTAIGRGDGHIAALRLAITLRCHQERCTESRVNVTGVGGENWRGYYWLLEKGKIGMSSSIDYERLIDHLFQPALPSNILRSAQYKEVAQELQMFTRDLFSKYENLPNTTKLDRLEIYRDANHGGAYLSAASGMARSMMPLCLKEHVDFAFSLNYKWKLPRHHLFVRALLEKENPILANWNTTTGGPAARIRFTNLHKFWPLWKGIVDKTIRIASTRLFGHSIVTSPRSVPPSFILPSWWAAYLKHAKAEYLVEPADMLSGKLYNPQVFQFLVEHSKIDNYKFGDFLDRAITIEMALRAVGTAVD